MFLAGRSPNTLRAYQTDLADFQAWLGGQGLATWLRMAPGEANATALEYRTSMTDRGLQAATVKRRLAALRAFSKLARMVGAITWTCEVSSPRVEEYRDTRGPGEDGYRAMLRTVRDGAAEGDVLAIRDRAIVRLLHDLGLRRGEVCSLDYEHIDHQRATVAVVRKGKRQSIDLTLPEPTVRALAEWLEVRGTRPGPLFHRLDRVASGAGRLTGESVRRIVARIGEEAGLVRRVRPHGLRHQAITEALDAGHGIRDVMKFAGHSNPATTMIYDDNRRDLGGAVARSIARD
jgi:integrase/recombinase XerC